MITCPNCGRELEDGVRFCGQCGARLIPADNASSAVGAVRSALPDDKTQVTPDPQNIYPYQPGQQNPQPNQYGAQYQPKPQQQIVQPQQYAQYQHQPQDEQPHQQSAQPQPRQQDIQPPPQHWQYRDQPGYEKPYSEQSSIFTDDSEEDPADTAKLLLIDLAKSPLFLIAAILYTGYVAFELISQLSYSLSHHGVLFEFFGWYEIATGFAPAVFKILTVISLWLIYSSAAGRNISFSTGVTGLKILRVLQKILWILVCIGAGLIIFAGLLTMAGVDFLNYYLSIFISRSAISSMGFVVIIIGVIALVIGILLYKSICGALDSALSIIEEGKVYAVPMGAFAAVSCFIYGGYVSLSAMGLLSMGRYDYYDFYDLFDSSPSLMINLFSGVAVILFGVLILKFLNIIKNYCYICHPKYFND